jgi:uncharacterized membrane protein
MAFTKAAEVANLVKRHVLPGVVISLGSAQGVAGIEVVVKGYSHPEDGMSRVWHVHLLGQSGMMLDLIIRGLRKAGFEMSGSAPLMRGRLTQVLSRAEVAQMRQAVRDANRNQKEILQKAEIQAAATVAHATNGELETLRSEVDRLKEMIEDMALMPTPRGLRGPAGVNGRDGLDGTANLEAAALGDIGDVSDETPLDQMVLTWRDGKWRPWRVPFRSISQIHAAGGGGGGAGSVGPQGPQGEPGIDGRSAYELAVIGGFVGTEAEWLTSLRGEAGLDGLSAYQVAANAGFVGTEQEWLDSLQGEPGQTAYELAIELGFVGTQEEWIESLRGVDGDDGLSAYELALAGGFVGTEVEWLESLVGPPGEDGSGGTGGSLTVQQRNRDDMSAAPTGIVSNVSTLSFDTDSGFEVQDLGNGSLEAFIKLNSTFNPWHVQGQTTLDATGEEPVEFVEGSGMRITTDATSDPKRIIFSVTGTSEGGIPEAPRDGRFWVRSDGGWVELSCALAALMVGDGGQFSPEGDGGNFTTGYSGTWTDRTLYDGSNITDDTTDAVNDYHLDGQVIYSPDGEGGDFTHDDADGDNTSNIETNYGYDGGNFTTGDHGGSCDGLDGGEFS